MLPSATTVPGPLPQPRLWCGARVGQGVAEKVLDIFGTQKLPDSSGHGDIMEVCDIYIYYWFIYMYTHTYDIYTQQQSRLGFDESLATKIGGRPPLYIHICIYTYVYIYIHIHIRIWQLYAIWIGKMMNQWVEWSILLSHKPWWVMNQISLVWPLG